MSDINDGGPAFPVPDVQASEPRNVEQMRREARGMSLRDYFAAKAMQGMLSCSVQPQSGPDMYARDAYTIADAMLKARSQS